jgi:hypothetical protein
VVGSVRKAAFGSLGGEGTQMRMAVGYGKAAASSEGRKLKKGLLF